MLNIIMPVYNTDFNLFKRACYSYLTQTKKSLLLVIDDCSKKDFSQLYKNFCYNNKIEYVRLDKNIGPGMARQYGIEKGFNNCDYISFLDSDDILLPHYVELLTSEIQKNNADVCTSNILVEGKTRNTDYIIKENNGTWLHGKIYKKSFLLENKLFFSNNILFNEDVYFNLNILYKTNKKIYLDKETYLWHNNKNSITRKEDNINWYKKHNIGYFLANIFVLKNILSEKRPVNIGIILGQLYNAYQNELILNGKKQEKILKYIININLNYLKNQYNIYINKKNTNNLISSIINNNFSGTFYYQNINCWLSLMEEEICYANQRYNAPLYYYYFGKGRMWERYRGYNIKK